MQSRAARLGLIAAVVVAAVVVFVVLKGNNNDNSNDTAKGVQVFNVDAERQSGGRRQDADLQQGRAGRAPREPGRSPRTRSMSTATRSRSPPSTARSRFSFPAKLDGVFEIEVHKLHESGDAQIGELHVNP